MKKLILAMLTMLAVTAKADDYMSFTIIEWTDIVTNKIDLGHGVVQNAYWCYGRVATDTAINVVIAYAKENDNGWTLYDSSDEGENGFTRVGREYAIVKKIAKDNMVLTKRNFQRYETNRYETSKEQR